MIQKSGVRSQKAAACVVLGLLVLAGCSGIQRDPPIEVWDDMRRQEKFKPQTASSLFADGRSTRVPPEGTVARGHLMEETPYNTGMEGALYLGKNPRPITAELLHQGQLRFNTYCSPCHDKTGSGRGIVPTRVPTWQPSNLMEDRLVEAADGDLFNVITNGRRSMPPYRFQVMVDDRWAIIAYVRLLQRAAHGGAADLTPEQRASLQ